MVIENTNIHLVIISCVTVNYFPGCTPMFKTLFVSKFNHNFMSMFLLPSNQHIRGNLDLPGFNIFYCVTDNSTWVFLSLVWKGDTLFVWMPKDFPASIFLLKVNNRNTWTRCEICPKLSIKTPEWCNWRCSVVFIVNFGHISHLFLVFLLLICTSKCYLVTI